MPKKILNDIVAGGQKKKSTPEDSKETKKKKPRRISKKEEETVVEASKSVEMAAGRVHIGERGVNNVSTPPPQATRMYKDQKIEEFFSKKGSQDTQFPEQPPVPPKKRSKVWGGVFIILLVAAVSVAVYAFSYGAVINITPRAQEISLEGNIFNARKSAQENLGFEIMTLELSKKEQVPADGVEEVEEYASGKITIYNEYGKAPQRLIKNTRFESPEGNIYRIRESVDVPGMKTDGDATTPGSLEVTVYADEPGESYNIGPTDFTIPGFKSDSERYKLFYAKSHAPISGGHKGPIKIVSEENRTGVRERLEETIRTELLQDAKAEKPDAFILFERAQSVTFTDEIENSGDSGDDKATVAVTGTLNAIIFNEKQLSQYVAREKISGYDDSSVIIPTLSSFSFELMGDNTIVSESLDSIEFILSGDGTVMWIIDEELIKESFVNVNKNNFNDILSRFKGVEKATAKIKPIWRRTFPDNKEDITVILEGVQ